MSEASPSDPMREEAAEGYALEHAVACLRANREGILAFDDHHIAIRTTIENTSGKLIASLPVATFFSGEHILFLPDENDDALQLLVSPEEIEESNATDRWLAYHREPEHVRWASLWIDSGKHGPWVFDGDALTIPNALASVESRLVKRVNEDPGRLIAYFKRLHDLDLEDPLCVGVDQLGIDVRVRFGILRAPFAQPAIDPDHASRLMEKVLKP